MPKISFYPLKPNRFAQNLATQPPSRSSVPVLVPVPEPTPNPLPSNCIQFVVDTYFGMNHYLNAVSSGPTDYTVDWGDGNTGTGTIDGSTSLDYTYNDPGSYTVTLCFTDPSLITELDFIGDD